MSWLTPFKEDHKAVLFLLDKLEGLLKDIEYLGLRPTMFAELHEFVEVLDGDIYPHFAAEEKSVYPKAAGVDEQARIYIEGMFAEHQELYRLFDGFKRAVEEQNAEAIRGQGTAVISLLREHIMKEETEVRRLVELADSTAVSS